MNIEGEIFKKSSIVYEKLVSYGFKKQNGSYLLSKNILDDQFRVDIKIPKETGLIEGKIYDLSFNEEYTNYRIESQNGEFVNRVREEFIKILNDIKDNCTTTKYFITNQANRIADKVNKKYGDKPEFAWTKFPGYGIFRNSRNAKWYALIMNINKSKIDKGNEEVEIINVKLDENEVKTLLKRKGFYKAYHMNKENWISIILDDSIEDEEIVKYIEESHKYTEEVNEWIVPANPKFYDVINCFDDTGTVLWKQSSNISQGDIVYLYVAAPYSSLMYKCEVIETNIPYKYKDKNISMSTVMKLKLIKKFDKDKYTFDILKKYGVTAIRGPRYMPKNLSAKIEKGKN